jgi:4-diphosphocytidyl-2-C-methyl-D-erythritol kinase
MILPGPGYPAPGKLNLFLHVVGRRGDGYHLLQSVFALIDRADEVRLRIRADGEIRRVGDLPGVAPEDDLSIRAARLLQRECGTALGADIEVAKALPMGGGLGGGSSDAATVLLALNHLWQARLGRPALAALGLALGADVPFFIGGDNALVEGVGERLTPVEVAARWYLVLVPPVAVATREMFQAPELTRNTPGLKISGFSAETDFGGYRNDLEPVVAARFPEVGAHLEWLSRHARARLTGSGACVFAQFGTREEARAVHAEMPPGMQGFVAQGLLQHPLRELGE